jgi:hypothetical protein
MTHFSWPIDGSIVGSLPGSIATQSQTNLPYPRRHTSCEARAKPGLMRTIGPSPRSLPVGELAGRAELDTAGRPTSASSRSGGQVRIARQ